MAGQTGDDDPMTDVEQRQKAKDFVEAWMNRPGLIREGLERVFKPEPFFIPLPPPEPEKEPPMLALPDPWAKGKS
jgi:hypothetical protein